MTERGPVIPPGHQGSYDQYHFAPAYRVGDTVYVSGVIGVGAGGVVPDDPAEEFALAFRTLAATLDAAGSSVDEIVDMTSFHVDIEHTIGPFLAAKDAALHAPYPAWTAIGCTGLVLPGARAEVKVTAVDR